MPDPVKVRRLTDHEGRQLQQIVRRGGGKSQKSIVRWRRAMVVMASASGNTVPAIARLVATSEDRVREMIHRFNDKGMASLDPTTIIVVVAVVVLGLILYALDSTLSWLLKTLLGV